VVALRAPHPRRHLERFTELETERDAIETELAGLDAEPAKVMSPELLDALPQIPGILAELPLSQVTCRAVITDSTPQTVNAIINDSTHGTGTTQAPSSDSDCVPGTTPIG
jgi:hypothetical protein